MAGTEGRDPYDDYVAITTPVSASLTVVPTGTFTTND